MEATAESAESDYENSWFIFMFIVALSGELSKRHDTR
jgi:hypothetical protein